MATVKVCISLQILGRGQHLGCGAASEARSGTVPAPDHSHHEGMSHTSAAGIEGKGGREREKGAH